MTAQTHILRTTAFRLTPERLGQVYLCRVGDGFKTRWQALQDEYKARKARDRYDPRSLPFATLAAALRINSGGFVRLQPRDLFPDRVWLVCADRIAPQVLADTALIWEQLVFERDDSLLRPSPEDFEIDQVAVGNFLTCRSAHCPQMPGWAWEAGRWSLARTLAAAPLLTDDGPKPLRLDSNADLLTWEHRLCAGDKRQSHALHRTLVRLITVPGVEDLVLHLDSRLSRLWNGFGKVRYGWLDLGGDRLIAELGLTRLPNNGDWAFFWRDRRLVELIARSSTIALPEAAALDWQAAAEARARLERIPADHRIGSGVGQHYHAYIAVHARDQLPDCPPLVLEKAVKQFRGAPLTEKLPVPDAATLNSAIEAAEPGVVRILCLYRNTATRKRMIDGLGAFFEATDGRTQTLPDRQWSIRGRLHWCLADLPLGTDLDADAILGELRGLLADGAGRTVALVETATEPSDWGKDGDDKPRLRSALLRLGIASQFIHAHSASADHDFAMQNALWDLLRIGGVLPIPVTDLQAALPPRTWLLGTFAVKPTKQAADARGLRIATVGLLPGGRRAMAWIDDDWRPLGDAAPHYQAGPPMPDARQARQQADNAIRRLLARAPGTRAIWLLDGDGCGQLWPALYDKRLKDAPAHDFPGGSRSPDVAVLRVRSKIENLPRPAAKGAWNQGGIGNPTGMQGALLRIAGAAADTTPRYFVSMSRIMGEMGPHRSGTRFRLEPRDLRRPWHALRPTELLCLHPGPFAPDDLYDLSARLMRRATHWGGVQSLPVPVHLAAALIGDCPDVQEDDATED